MRHLVTNANLILFTKCHNEYNNNKNNNFKLIERDARVENTLADEMSDKTLFKRERGLGLWS